MDAPRPPKIAIVDDDESVRESLVGLVESVGYDVAFFSSAEEFLSLARLDQFACLIFDVRLPGMSGLQLFCHLRTNRQRIPTVIITAHADAAIQSRALAQGAEVLVQAI